MSSARGRDDDSKRECFNVNRDYRSNGDNLPDDVTERKRLTFERDQSKIKEEDQAKNKDKHKKKDKKKEKKNKDKDKDKKKKDSDVDKNSKSSSSDSSSSSSSSSSDSDSDSDSDDNRKEKKNKEKKKKKEKDKKKDKKKKKYRHTTMTATTDLDGGSLRKSSSTARGPSFNNDSGNDTSVNTETILKAQGFNLKPFSLAQQVSKLKDLHVSADTCKCTGRARLIRTRLIRSST